MLASVILIALTAVIVKMNDSKKASDTIVASNQTAMSKEEMDLAITPAVTPAIEGNVMQQVEPGVSVKDEQVQEDATGQTTDVSVNQNVGTDQSTSVDTDNEEYEIYVVQAGDTLADISYKKFGEAKKSRDIAKLNNISNTNQIYVGQQLKLPNYNE